MANEPSKKTAPTQTIARPHEALVNQVRELAQLGTGPDAFEIASQVLDAMAVADSWDAIVDAQGNVQDMENYLGVPLNVTEVDFMVSEEKFRTSGIGVYCVIHAYDDKGETVTLTTGATNVVGALFRAKRLELIGGDPEPLRMKINGRETRNGTLYMVGSA